MQAFSVASAAEGLEPQFDLLVSKRMCSAAFPTLRAIVEDAGRLVGLGDFRVEKNGPFGKFHGRELGGSIRFAPPG